MATTLYQWTEEDFPLCGLLIQEDRRRYVLQGLLVWETMRRFQRGLRRRDRIGRKNRIDIGIKTGRVKWLWTIFWRS